MVVNSVGAFAPRAVDRSQSFVPNRWNPYASGPAEPLLPGYGFGGPGPAGYHPLNHQHHPPHHHPHQPHHAVLHPLVAAADESHGHGLKFTSTAEEYGASAHGGGSSGAGGGYDYHPAPPPQPPPLPPSIIHHPLPPAWPAPAPGGKGKGKGAALSALTLLAFLYFLNLLQSCLKEHMDTMNPTVMVMTAGANRRKYILDRIDSSVEQAPGGGSGEDEPLPDQDRAGPDAAVAAYERLSHRYQLLTSSNRTRNPFRRPTNRARNKAGAPSRYEKRHGHTGSDEWFDRSGVDHGE